MNSGSRIAIEFIVTSLTMSPEKMAEVLPFTPDKSWRLGDTVGRTSLRYKHNGALLSLPKESDVYEIEPIVLKLLDRLEPIKDELIRLSETYPLDFEISCAVYFDRPPACNLSPHTIKRMAELRAAFDLDLIPSDIAGGS
ncbi:MAG: hypothetical protein NVSMB14_08460 [Isosphaeraceae bacterium]